MIRLRKSGDRGHFNMGWLDTYHTFSFGEYFDENHVEFRALRVINEDRVQPMQGFPKHGHRDMEIVTYVLEGALEHKDSMGNGSVIRPGDVQRMSAGRGVLHSEYNHSKKESVHLLQIWIFPKERGLEPSYEQKHFTAPDKKNKLRMIASPTGADGAVVLHQDAHIFASVLETGKQVGFKPEKGRGVWVQVARGRVDLNGQSLQAGDGAAIENETEVTVKALVDGSEFLLFDLP